jgi:serine/threonine protein kinase
VRPGRATIRAMAVTRYCPRCLTTFPEDPPACPNMGCGAPRPEAWPTLLQPGDVLDRTYRVLSVLAGGAAGMTYRCRELDADDALVGPELAIKVLYHQRDSGPFLRRLATEAQILQGLQHPHIVECLGFVHRAGRAPYLVTRYEAGGTLQQHIARVGPLPVPVAAATVHQVVDALSVAHRADIVHRDLKPGNILLRAAVEARIVPDTKVADFGIAKVHGSLGGLTRVGAFVGTPEYAAPEQLLGQDPGPPTDLFAAGGLLWFLLTGRPPVRVTQRHDPVHTYQEVVDQVPRRLPVRLAEPDVDGTLQAIIDGLMAVRPEDRWEARRTLEALDALADGTSPPPVPPRNPPEHAEAGRTLFIGDPELGEHDSDPGSHLGGNRGGHRGGHRGHSGDETDPAPTLVAPHTPPPPAPRVSRRLHTATSEAPTPPAGPSSTMEGLFDFGEDAVEEPMEAPTEAAGGTAPAPPRPPGAPRPGLPSATDALAFGDAEDSVLDATFEDLPPEPPPPAPGALPETPEGLLRALGDADPAHHDALAAALETHDESAVSTALRQARRHDDAAVRRGAALAVALLARSDQTTLVRGLMRDPSDDVRAGAAAALGAVGAGSLLPQLARLLEDDSPRVRAAAAEAVARAYRRDGDLARGREHLRRLGADRDPAVRDALGHALEILAGRA